MYVYMGVCVCLRMYVCICVFLCLYLADCIWMNGWMNGCTHACMYVCLCVCVWVCVRVHACVCVSNRELRFALGTARAILSVYLFHSILFLEFILWSMSTRINMFIILPHQILIIVLCYLILHYFSCYEAGDM